MALVTKQYLYETISYLLEGGSPSAGKKFETRMVQAYLQQAINRKLKTEYLSVTLPGDETIPEGLVLACYDNILVEKYNGVSRAKLPAMPVSLRRNMGVYFVGPAADGQLTPAEQAANAYFIIEAVTDGGVFVTGTDETITGISTGSNVIICNAFAGKYVNIIRGNIPTPGIDPQDGSNYFTKVLPSNIITLSNPLAGGEYLKIEGYIPIVPQIPTFQIIESIIGTNVAVTGMTDAVTGLTDGSSSVVSNAFVNKNVRVIRGSTAIPGIDPGDGSNYFTKVLSANSIAFNNPFVTGEYIKIETL